MTSIEPFERSGNPEAIAFKQVMTASIERFLEDHPDASRKRIALDLGATPADLSHWTSAKTSFTLPGHLVPLFCQILNDNALLWHLESVYARRTA